MPRQNPALLPSAANLLAAAGSIRAALSAGDFESLKKGLTSAADGFEQAGAAIASMERRLRDLGQPNVDLSGRAAPVVVSGDRIRGGIPVQGILPNLAGQSLDLTFASQVAHVTSMDHGTGGYLELDLDGLGVKINAHGGTITLTGTLSLSAPLPVAQGGTGTATGSITGTGALTFASTGATTVALKPGTDSTTAIQLQKAAGTALVSVDTTNEAMDLISTGTATSRGLGNEQYGATSGGARIQFRKARGSKASPTTVATSDNVGLVLFNAYGTTMANRATIYAMVSGAVSVDSVPTDLAFQTGDGVTTADRMRITSAGNVLIGTGTVGASLVRIVGLPTSAAGLSAGDVWSNAGVLTIA